MRTPECRIDLIVGVERSDNDIGDASIALGVTGFAGKLHPDLPELRRQGRIQDRFGMCELGIAVSLLVDGLAANLGRAIISALQRWPPLTRGMLPAF